MARSAADAFRLLADDTRIAILRAVARAQRDADRGSSGPVELAFSEIYERADVEGTSKLSYHLGELTDVFLRKGASGYSFTHAGEQLVRLILAENFADPPAFGPVATEGQCPFCEQRELAARLHHQFFLVACKACERPVANHSITPAQIRDSEPAAVVERVKHKQASEYRQVRSGHCPACGGTLSTRIEDISDAPLPDADPFLVVDRCADCLREYGAQLSYGLAYHPASVAFHWNRGLDVSRKGLWEFHEFAIADRWTAERVESDPDRYRVSFRQGTDALRMRVDADATVEATERLRRRDPES